MNIEKMEFKNFMSFKNESFEFGHRTKISGHNEKGKSTLRNGFSWLFVGVCEGSLDLDYPNPIINGEKQRDVETSVTVVADGVSYTKTVTEKYEHPKGTANRVLKGYTAKFKIDGVVKTKGKFQDKVKELFCDIKTFGILTNVSAFTDLHWQKRREYLLAGEGVDLTDKTDEIAKAKSERVLLKKLALEFGPRIDEKTNSIEPADFVQSDLDGFNDKLKELNNKKASIENGGDSLSYKEDHATKTGELNTLVGQRDLENQKQIEENNSSFVGKSEKLLSLQNEASDICNRACDRDNKPRVEALAKVDELQSKQRDNNTQISQLNTRINQLNSEREALLTDYRNLTTQSYNGETVCPTCQRELESDKIEAATNQFNLNKSKSIEENTKKGKANKLELDSFSKKANEISEDSVRIQTEIDSIVIPNLVSIGSLEDSEEIKSLKNEIKNPTPFEPFPNVDLDNKIRKLEYEINTINSTLEGKKGNSKLLLEPVELEIKEVESTIEELVSLREKKNNQDSIAKRIVELQEEKLLNGQRIADYDCLIMKLEDEIKDVIEKIEAPINERFKFTKWKLFKININGGVEPCCDPVVDGIEYPKLNTAKQINCSIDIINTLSREKGVVLPLFIDNAECNCEIEEAQGQMIELHVLKNSELKIEIEA